MTAVCWLRGDLLISANGARVNAMHTHELCISLLRLGPRTPPEAEQSSVINLRPLTSNWKCVSGNAKFHIQLLSQRHSAYASASEPCTENFALQNAF